MTKNKNLFALVEARLPRNLDGACLETPEGLVYTWRDLLYASARLAGWLSSLRLAAGDDPPPRIAAQVEKSPEALLLYLATLRAGFAHVPLNPAYRLEEVEYFLRDAQPAVFVCAPQRAAELQPLARSAGVAHLMTLGERRDGSLLAAAAAFGDRFATVARRADDPAAIVYTSGTTGRSKGAMLSHGNLAANALVLDDFWGFKEEREAGDQDVLLHALPLFHVHGLFVAAHAALLAGARMIFLPRFEAAEVIRHLPRATVFMGVPTHYVRLLADPRFDRQACRNMRLFVSGSAPLAKETFDEFQRRTGQTILERYGMTETLMLVSNPYFGIAARDRIGGTVGVPLPGVAVRVVDEAGAPCAPGVVGHVQVRGANVFSGYWRIDRSAEEFTADGYFRTGDLGCFGGSAYGAARPPNFLTLVGRSRDLIISGGYNVYPKEVERCIDEIAGVVESAVIGLPHPDLGEAVVAVVVADAQRIDGAQIVAHLKERIAGFKVPKRVWIVAELPRNAMGKVQKNLLRQRYAETFAAGR